VFSIDSSPKAWFNQIYLNLGNFRGGLPSHYKVEFSYHHLVEQTSVPYQVQFNLPETFRKFLIYELRLYQYQVNNPLELAPELRTERWQILCDHLTDYPALTKSTQVKVINLLSSLCFHQSVLEYVPSMSAAEISRDSHSARLALSRAISNLLIYDDHQLSYNLKELETIAQNAPVGSMARIAAGLQLLVVSGNILKDVEGAEFWRSIVDRQIQEILPSLEPFVAGLLMSKYYRAASFVPLLKKDRAQLIAEMDLCQAYAEGLNGETREQQYISHENENIVIESRAKEALWLKDLDLAEERTRKLIERGSLEPRYRLELGEILLKRGKVEEAAQAYRSATRLGPPGTAVAWFMMGQCYQSLGELELAYDCYLACLDCDPLAISPVKRLGQIAPLLGDENLASWSQLRLSQLQEEKAKMEANGSIFDSYVLKVPKAKVNA
jgi:tetratricopeptide (TPR) repeat protein